MEGKKILKIAKGELQDNAVWFMRQAGRYLPEYDSLKAGRQFVDFLNDPKAIFEVSSLPLKYIDVDAIVVFTDILLPFTRMGYRVKYENGISVIRDEKEELDYYPSLSAGIERISEGHPEKTIIGVVGGPFTTLSYLYDGGDGGYRKTKEKLISSELETLSLLTDKIVEFAKSQSDAGADVIQVFDSWVGNVSETFYMKHIREMESRFLERIKALGKPVIFYSEGSSHLYRQFLELEPDVYSIDWRVDLDRFRDICNDCIVQGNLDPNILGADDRYLRDETRRIMKQGSKFRGHIFNLGHGVKPWTDWKKLALIAKEVHKFER
jgi:uroporphyrinogen decarboxylase